MKITVDRTNTLEGNLIFTINVTEPHHTCFGEKELQMMKLLDICKDDVNRIASEENKTKDEITRLIYAAKEKAFVRILDNLKFAITNEFSAMFKPICQEIYNWIQDKQVDDIKAWMIEFLNSVKCSRYNLISFRRVFLTYFGKLGDMQELESTTSQTRRHPKNRTISKAHFMDVIPVGWTHITYELRQVIIGKFNLIDEYFPRDGLAIGYNCAVDVMIEKTGV